MECRAETAIARCQKQGKRKTVKSQPKTDVYAVYASTALAGALPNLLKTENIQEPFQKTYSTDFYRIPT